jgi:hypothetical protein
MVSCLEISVLIWAKCFDGRFEGRFDGHPWIKEINKKHSRKSP